MKQLSESILRVLAYFDVFNYPITIGEMHQFLDQPVGNKELEPVVSSLLNKQAIWQMGQFYSLRNDPQLERRRLNANMLAVKHLKIAMIVSRGLAWCPYIRGVGISGSLSKNVAYKGSDFDFFTITAANRLWIARSFQYLFIRAFGWLGIRRICCLNYYIDEEALEIEEKNIFTATEVATLLPARGKLSFLHFFSSNQWIYEFVPNASLKSIPLKEISSCSFKKWIEWMLNSSLGDRIDNALLKYFSRRWSIQQVKSKHKKVNGLPFGGVTASKHLCKPMPKSFQQSVLNRYQEKIADVKNRRGVVPD